MCKFEFFENYFWRGGTYHLYQIVAECTSVRLCAHLAEEDDDDGDVDGKDGDGDGNEDGDGEYGDEDDQHGHEDEDEDCGEQCSLNKYVFTFDKHLTPGSGGWRHDKHLTAFNF